MRWLEGQRIQYSDMREDRFQRRRKQEIRESEGGSESQNYVSDIGIYIYISQYTGMHTIYMSIRQWGLAY